MVSGSHTDENYTVPGIPGLCLSFLRVDSHLNYPFGIDLKIQKGVLRKNALSKITLIHGVIFQKGARN